MGGDLIRSRRAGLIGALACALLVAGAQGSQAKRDVRNPSGAHAGSVITGTRWPGKPAVIRYSNATRYRQEVRAAAAAWNRSGARVRFVQTTDRSRAALRIIYRAKPGIGGVGTLGYAPVDAPMGFEGGVVGRGPYTALPRPGSGATRLAITQIATHELGHNLGLFHENRRCAAMNTKPYGRCTTTPCTYLRKDDASGAVRVYGGRIRAPRENLCGRQTRRLGR